MKRTLLLLLTFLFVLIGCATADNKLQIEPEWITDTQTPYPTTEYITGMGYGSTQKIAEDAAFEALARYLQQDISINTLANQQLMSDSEGFNQAYQITKQINTSSSIKKIVGVSIRETWYDQKETYYALAVLNKAEATLYYVDTIKANNRVVDTILSRVGELKTTSQSGSFEAYVLLRDALHLAEENEQYLAVLILLNSTQYKFLLEETMSSQAIQFVAEEEVKKIQLQIQVKGDIDSLTYNELSSIFNNKGISITTQGNSNYLLNCTIQFSAMTAQEDDIIYVRYTFAGVLTDEQQNKNIYSFSYSDKDGHKTLEEAQKRGVRTIASYIQSELSEELFASVME